MSHNKKRNVGIIYEQLLLKAAAALVDNDVATAKKCSEIIKKYYKPGTEIYKEHRLFQALLNTTIITESLGLRLIQEARRGVHIFSYEHLEKEKSSLIREINKTLDDDSFFNQPIKEYRLYATLQTLLNDWRKEHLSDLGRVVEYETKLLEWMKRDKTKSESLTELKTAEVNNLSVKIMREKFEKKWGNKLNETQRSLIKNYIDGKIDKNTLEVIKNRALRGLNRLEESSKNDVLLEKLENVRKNIQKLPTDLMNEKSVMQFMQLTNLYEELENKDD
jgi:hypothetical protein